MLTEHRVFGCPGCGKTTYLSKQVRGAVAKYGPNKVLVTSFTKSAAIEIATRLGNDGIRPDKRQVGTLHSMCYQLLESPPIADLPEPIEEWNKVHGLAWRLTPTGSRNNDDLYPALAPGDLLRRECDIQRAQMIPGDQWIFRDQGAKRFWKDWSEFKKDIKAIDFTDMIEEVYRLKIGAPNEPAVIFADETQDYSKLELSLLRFWASDDSVDHSVIAGDDDQAIYGFRGARPDAFLTPKIPDNQKHVLRQSYRLPREIKDFSANWIKRVRHREPKEFSARDDLGAVEHRFLTCLDGEGVVRAAQDNLSSESKQKNLMILTSCSYMLRDVVLGLKDKGIPFHNPYRVKNGAWNPMRGGVQRLLDFLKVGPSSEYLWTWKSLWHWLEFIDQKKSGVVRGNKNYVKGLARSNEECDKVVRREEILALFGRTQSFPWEGREIEWFGDMCMTSKKPMMQYSLTMAEKGGIERLEEKPRIVVGTIHCSPPDEKILTTIGWVPIGELVPGFHRLASYMKQSNRIVWGGRSGPQRSGYAFEKSSQLYSGYLIAIETERSRSVFTPNHRVFVQFRKNFFGRHVVYLMRRGRCYRLGICSSGHRPYRAGDLSSRLATEKADAGWILSIHDSRHDALKAEATVQSIYGIPGLCFESAKSRAFSTSELMAIHTAAADSVNKRVVNLFSDFNLLPCSPLYIRAGGGRKMPSKGNTFETAASNFISGYMNVPTTGVESSRGDSRRPIFLPARSSLVRYSGDVFGLDVQIHHCYISGGAVVHNSVKGAEADTVILFPDLSTSSSKEYVQSGNERDNIIRTFYVGMTRAKNKLILCESGSQYKVGFRSRM